MDIKDDIWEFFKDRYVRPTGLNCDGLSFEIDFGFCQVQQPHFSSFKDHINILKNLLNEHATAVKNKFIDSEGFAIQPKAYLGTGNNNGHPLKLIAFKDIVGCYYGAISWHIELSLIESLIEDYDFVLRHQSMIHKESNRFLATRYENMINPKKLSPEIARGFIKLVESNKNK
jgi:hypothetical protein